MELSFPYVLLLRSYVLNIKYEVLINLFTFKINLDLSLTSLHYIIKLKNHMYLSIVSLPFVNVWEFSL